MSDDIALVIEDDESNPRRLEASLPGVAKNCDLLLGPYSTNLMKAAGRIAAEEDWLLWNHGGSGDDAEVAHPGHVVSVLTPTRRYMEPFLRHLATGSVRSELWILHGKGSFGRQVSAGAEHFAQQLGFRKVRNIPAEQFSEAEVQDDWNLISVGRFEDDVELVKEALGLPNRPSSVCAVAAGVRDFGTMVDGSEAVYGVAQWFPGGGGEAHLGPAESEFLGAYRKVANTVPDYPAVQAVAAGVLATHCAREAGGTTRDSIWPVAAALGTETLFGRFRINPDTGVQIEHVTTLVQWTDGQPAAVPLPKGSPRPKEQQ